MLFCPHCSAPQIRLPEHMLLQTNPAVAPGKQPTTGNEPPPHPRRIDWPVAMRCGSLVALGAVLLSVLGFFNSFASKLETFWVLGCAFLAVGLYRRSVPKAWLDGATGLRIGLVSGVLTIAALGLSLSIAGVLARFVLHRMAEFDGQMAQGFAAMQLSMAQKMNAQGADKNVQQHLASFVASPEVRSGLALFYLAVSGVMILVFAAAGGAFAGMLQDRRRLLN